MQIFASISRSLVSLLALVVCGFVSPGMAGTTREPISLQGIMPGLADGEYEIIVRVWDAESGGQTLASDQVTTTVSGGLFSLIAELPGAESFGELFAQDRWWSAEVVGHGESARQRVSSVPRSMSTRGIVVDENGRVGISALRINGLSTGDGDLGLLTWASTDPSGPTSSDGFRFVRTNIDDAIDYFVFEKTDGNDGVPDGGIAFARAGENGVRRLMLSMTGTGQVVIGDVADPRGRPGLLNVAGNGYFTGSLNSAQGLGVQGNGTFDGRVSAAVVEIRGGSDLAEPFRIETPPLTEPMPGMVVSIDPDNPGTLTVSDKEYDRLVVGVISGANGLETGLIIGQKAHEVAGFGNGRLPVAMLGRVYVLADDSNGPIGPGTMLTSSGSRAGHAMAATDRDRAFGAVIGKALGEPDDRGYVLMVVQPR